MESPAHLELKKDHGLTVTWSDGSTSFYPIAHLRRMSPSADMRQLRDQIRSNPLTVLPVARTGRNIPLTVTSAELVGNYAIKLVFSDGHSSGIFSWTYLRGIDPSKDQTNRPLPPVGAEPQPSDLPRDPNP